MTADPSTNFGGKSAVKLVRAPVNQEMEAFDSLPPDVRRAMWECSFNSCALAVVDKVRAFGPASVVRSIMRASRMQAQTSDLHTAARASIVAYDESARHPLQARSYRR